MEQYHRNYSICEDSEKYADQMKLCHLLLKRLIEEDYSTPYDDRNKPHLAWFRKKFEKSMSAKADENGMIRVISRNEPNAPDARWIIPAHNHETKQLQQDLDLLCETIRKNAQSWWD
jgi:hypothetical protein